jgi:hypothetical protein
MASQRDGESQLNDGEWEDLVRRIGEGNCTPFLGAGVAAGILPLGAAVAETLSEQYDYPYGKSRDLTRVAQYLAIERDPMFVKEKIAQMVGGATLPDRRERPDEPHHLLARLPLPVYLTTNYDDLMAQALVARRRDPVRDLCRWSENVSGVPSAFDRDNPPYTPTPANPLVFHLHGRAEVVPSLVVTEDDYLEFLSNISGKKELIPPRVVAALAGTALLFIGYQLADWNFRVILRGLARPGYTNYAVMPPPEGGETAEKARNFLTKYYGSLKIRMYWGTAQEFLSELFDRAGGRLD